MGSGFRTITWLVLLAFALQSFITQTHIHGTFSSAGDAQIVKTLASVPSHGSKAPAENNADCPFCQAITHAGAFFTPSTPTLILPVIWAEMVAPPVIDSAIDSFSSHPWQSRAPPRH
jgi:Protein of unknown function (DUF2946)